MEENFYGSHTVAVTMWFVHGAWPKQAVRGGRLFGTSANQNSSALEITLTSLSLQANPGSV